MENPEEAKKAFEQKALLNFEELFKDCKDLDAVAFKQKYGIEKEYGKSILDSLWLEMLTKMGRQYEVYIDFHKSEFNKKIEGVELFEVGHHNGQTFTDEEVKAIVESTKKMIENQNLQIPIKLGHSDEQGVAKTLFGGDSKGMPALGWVKNLQLVGKKIIGDLVDIPDQLYEMIVEKMYNNRSVELWEGFVDNKGNNAGTVMTALALLGAEQPAVTTLATLFDHKGGKSRMFTSKAEELNIPKGEQTMPDKDITTAVVPGKGGTVPEAKNFELNEFANEAALKKHMLELKGKADDGERARKELVEYKKTARAKEDADFIDKACEKGKLLPFQAEYLKPILNEVENREVKYFDKSLASKDQENGPEMKSGAKDLLKKFIMSLPDQVRLEELSIATDHTKVETLSDAAKRLQRENKDMTYEAAVKLALQQHPELEQTDRTK